MQGAAVEDVQSRLLQLGYTIDAAEVTDKYFGAATEQAVSTFRLDSAWNCSKSAPPAPPAALLPVMPSISPAGAPL